MKRWVKQMRYLCCVLLLLSLCPIVQAEDEASYYDCVVIVGGYDSQNQLVGSAAGIQVEAGDGSGNTWVVTQSGMAQGATQYIAIDPMDTGSNSYAQLIVDDADSGIAVFQLDSRLQTRSCPTLRTLDGLKVSDKVVVAGHGRDGEKAILFSRAAVLAGLDESGRYARLCLEDGSSPLSEIEISPIGVIMTSVDEVAGFYLGNYRALPAGYIMVGAGGIGSLEDDGQDEDPPAAPEDPDEMPDGTTQGSYTLETIQGDTGVSELLQEAEAKRSLASALRVGTILGAVVIAAGLIVFAILRTRREQGAAKTSAPQPAPVQPMQKTEYVAAQDYKKTEPVWERYQVTPVGGTPGTAREIPPQGLTFGRSPDCDVTFAPDTSGVSGRHCSLTWQGGVLCLTDLGSSFGTLLEDGRTLKGEGAEIGEGTVFYLGSKNIGFRLEKQ